MFKREDEMTLPGKPGWPNEDRCGFAGQTAWMIDGATGVTDRIFAAGQGGSDAAWLAGELHDYFAQSAAVHHGDLAGLLYGALHAIRKNFNALSDGQNLEPHEYPCAAVQLCHINGQGLHFAALGDCVAMAMDGTNFFLHGGDPAHHAVDENTINIYRELRAQGASHAKAREGILPVLRQARRNLNTPEGHSTFNLGQEHFHLIRTAVTPLQLGGQVLMLTDGFYRLRDVYGAYQDDQSLMQAAQAEGLESLGRNLRKIEDGDANTHTLRYKCLKPRDDATGLLLSVY